MMHSLCSNKFFSCFVLGGTEHLSFMHKTVFICYFPFCLSVFYMILLCRIIIRHLVWSFQNKHTFSECNWSILLFITCRCLKQETVFNRFSLKVIFTTGHFFYFIHFFLVVVICSISYKLLRILSRC